LALQSQGEPLLSCAVLLFLCCMLDHA
jgi:hypothetical protein